MVYWHIETDFVALAIYAVLFMKAYLLNKQKDYADRLFSLALILGIISTAIDIYASAMMNERLGWWAYEISMIIYGLSVPVLALFWFLYTVSLIYKANNERIRQFVVIFLVLYALYAVVIVTNPIHELYFHLTDDIVYSRGAWFLPLIVGSQTFLSSVGIVLLLFNWKKITPKSIFFLLLFLHFVTAASYYVQISFPGWLIVCSVYAVAFLVCDATFESHRRNLLYRTIQNSLEELKRDKEKELVYQKQLEEAVQEANRANLAKSEFLSRMSHDIRTPINGIMGMLEIIDKERRDTQRLDDCLEKIKASSGQLLSLINDVLDMSKLESGEILLSQESFNLCQLIEDCFSVLAPSAAAADISLQEDSVSKKPPHPYLIGSPMHLRQILLNIVGNAIKYNKKGGSVYCSYEELDNTDKQVVYRFVIRDTGIGIGSEFMPSLFQPFSQEHAGSPRTQYEGTGLGLAIVKKILDYMDGEISVESEQGVGSTFYVTIPFEIDHSPSQQSLAREGDVPNNLRGIHVLLVEDNKLNMEIAQYILGQAGATADVAMNGREALDKFKASQPGTYGVILMDIMMPVMDGLEAARAIRASGHADAADIPIIAMTANAFSEDRQKCLDAGMNDHLTKPLDVQKLIRTVHMHMKGQERTDDK